MVINLHCHVRIILLDEALLHRELDRGIPRRVHASAVVHSAGYLHVRVDPRHAVRVHRPTRQLHVLQVLRREHHHLQFPLRPHLYKTSHSLFSTPKPQPLCNVPANLIRELKTLQSFQKKRLKKPKRSPKRILET
jgi:hypothetical protein